MTLAVIMKMRQHVGLLIGAIGIAIVAFLLMDVFSGQSELMGGADQQNIVGEVEGKDIRAPEFQAYYEDLQRQLLYQQGFWRQQGFNWSEAEQHQIRDLAWDQMTEQAVLSDDLKDLGISVTPSELTREITSNNPRPEIQNFYLQIIDPNASSYNPSQMAGALNEIKGYTPGQEQYFVKDFYILMEKALKRQILKEKFTTLVSNSVYIPDWKATLTYNRENSTASFNYVTLPFSSIPDEEVEPSEEELQEYLDAHRDEFDARDTRSLEYVVFDILPTFRDTTIAQEWIEDKFEDFQTTRNDSLFITRFSDTPFDRFYYPKDEIQSSLVDTFFTSDTATFIGPYLEDGSLKVAKLIDRQIMPDSAQVRHILASTERFGNIESAAQFIDSLKTLIETGQADFDTLAMQNSDDQGSAAMGGDLGYINPQSPLVPNFYKAALIDHTEGDLFAVNTQFGVHLIEIMDTVGSSPKVKLAMLEKNISPGSRTRDSLYSVVSRFYSGYGNIDSFQAGIEKYGQAPRFADRQTGNELYIAGVNAPARAILKWAFESETKVGDIRLFKEYETRDDKYVVVKLAGIEKKGKPKLKDFREEVRMAVIKEKKTKMLKERLQNASGNTLEAIASALEAQVQSTSGVSFQAQFIEGIGREPEVASVAHSLSVDEMSKPFAGNTGIFVLKKTGEQPAPAPQDLTIQKRQLANQLESRFGQDFLANVMANKKIEDQRYRFY